MQSTKALSARGDDVGFVFCISLSFLFSMSFTHQIVVSRKWVDQFPFGFLIVFLFFVFFSQ